MHFKYWLNENEDPITIIGDVHGKHSEYLDIIKNKPKSIQLGDLGFDYSKLPDSESHKFFKGNHDNYDVNHNNDLGGFGMHNGFFYVRGADSIDKSRRIEGKNWWRKEQMEYKEMQDAISLYEKIKPNKVVSHDCPQIIAYTFFGIRDKNPTRMMLQQMYEIHEPSLWIFGHHHKSLNETFGKTRFVCLGELEHIDV